jgi:hypothetical protein
MRSHRQDKCKPSIISMDYPKSSGVSCWAPIARQPGISWTYCLQLCALISNNPFIVSPHFFEPNEGYSCHSPAPFSLSSSWPSPPIVVPFQSYLFVGWVRVWSSSVNHIITSLMVRGTHEFAALHVSGAKSFLSLALHFALRCVRRILCQ